MDELNYSCDDAAESLAAYALDALQRADRFAMVEHLAECRAHDEDLVAFRMVAGRLPLLAVADEAAAPPQGLRSSLLDAFDREVASSASVEAPTPIVAAPVAVAPDPVEALPARPKAGILAIFRQPSLAYGMAAALLIAVVSLAAWNISLQSDGENMLRTAAIESGMSLDVEYYEDQQVAILNIDMPPPGAGQVYQAWMITDGKPVSLGVVPGSQGRVAFATDMHGASAVALSLEPAGGSQAPTDVKIAAEF